MDNRSSRRAVTGWPGGPRAYLRDDDPDSTSEQWTYPGATYLHFTNGCLTTIQRPRWGSHHHSARPDERHYGAAVTLWRGTGRGRGRVRGLQPDTGDPAREGRRRVRGLRPDAGDRAGGSRRRVRGLRPDTGDRAGEGRRRVGGLQPDARNGLRGRRPSLSEGRGGGEKVTSSEDE